MSKTDLFPARCGGCSWLAGAAEIDRNVLALRFPWEGWMRRRAFIAGLGGAAALPVVARAQQQTDKVWRVGYLTPSSATNFSVAVFDAFRLKLNDLGYVEGRNLDLHMRRANDDWARLPGLASELVSLAPHVIVSPANSGTLALQRATSSIPIVMGSSTDPIGMGFVKSLAKPGGNITGLSNQGLDSTAKTLELLHVAVPNAKRIAVIMSANPGQEDMVRELYGAARTLGLTIIPVTARTSDDLGDAFAKMHSESCDALYVLPDPRNSRRIVELANEWRLPAIYQINDYIDMGGLLSYSPDYHESFRQAAVYVDRILKGANPADLPVQQPTKFELEINLKTAKTIPDSILARADKVIE
jgi:putative tryptophan/tyrosine transport system substrate-binding protein